MKDKSKLVSLFGTDNYKKFKHKGTSHMQMFIDKAVAQKQDQLYTMAFGLRERQLRNISIAVLFNKRYTKKIYEYDEAGNELVSYLKSYQFSGIEQKLKRDLTIRDVEKIKGYFICDCWTEQLYYDDIDQETGTILHALQIRTLCNFRCTNLKELRQLN